MPPPPEDIRRASEELSSHGITAEEYESTLLSLCASEESLTVQANLKLIQELLVVTDPNCRGEDGVTPLLSATILGAFEICQELIKRGADVNASGTSENRTPILLAALHRSLPITELYIEHNANLTHRDKSGKTALQGAAYSGSYDICKLLLENGAPLDADTTEGHDTLVCSFIGQSADIVRLFMSHTNVTIPDLMEGECNPLLISAVLDCRELLTLLIDGGADVNSVDEDGWTALMGAVKNLEVCRMLVNAGANVNHLDSDRRSPLMCAVMEDQKATAELLLQNGADINHQDAQGNTCLHIACRENMTEITTLLLNRNANFELSDIHNLAPLHICAVRGFSTMAMLFLNRGANIEVANCLQLTPLHVAVARGERTLLQLLIGQKANVNTVDDLSQSALMCAAATGNAQIAKVLIESKANVDHVDPDGWSALMCACVDGHVDTARLLLKRSKMCIHYKSKDGWTAHSIAAATKNEVLMDLIAEAGGGADGCAQQLCICTEASNANTLCTEDIAQDAVGDSPVELNTGQTACSWHTAASKSSSVLVSTG